MRILPSRISSFPINSKKWSKNVFKKAWVAHINALHATSSVSSKRVMTLFIILSTLASFMVISTWQWVEKFGFRKLNFLFLMIAYQIISRMTSTLFLATKTRLGQSSSTIMLTGNGTMAPLSIKVLTSKTSKWISGISAVSKSAISTTLKDTKELSSSQGQKMMKRWSIKLSILSIRYTL